MIGTALVLYPAWRWVTLRIGSKAALTVSVILFVVFMLPVLVVRTFPQAIAMMLLVGTAHSGMTLVREILLGDVIDEDELATGRRREGSYFGVCAFIERLVLVFIGGATGLVLTLSRYDAAAATQPATVSLGIRLGHDRPATRRPGDPARGAEVLPSRQGAGGASEGEAGRGESRPDERRGVMTGRAGGHRQADASS